MPKNAQKINIGLKVLENLKKNTNGLKEREGWLKNRKKGAKLA
jgi:hypothetical protein